MIPVLITTRPPLKSMHKGNGPCFFRKSGFFLMRDRPIAEKSPTARVRRRIGGMMVLPAATLV
mgnify:CR=1 FL=1